MIDSLVLHIGAGKTGTSAIQTGLVRHRDLLLEAGVRYPEHTSDHVARAGLPTSGNGEQFARFLLPELRGPDYSGTAFGAWLDRALSDDEAGANIVLYSDERLHRAEEANLGQLREMLEPRVRSVMILYYVRHAADMLAAYYRQRVRQAEFKGSFAQFIECFRLPYRRALSRYEAQFGRENIRVFNYDREKAGLFNGFLAAIPVSGLEAQPIEIVNRSLTDFELAVLNGLQKFDLGRESLLWISDRMVHGRKATRWPYRVSKAELETIVRNNESVIDFVNARYLEADGQLKMYSDEIIIR